MVGRCSIVYDQYDYAYDYTDLNVRLQCKHQPSALQRTAIQVESKPSTAELQVR